MTSAPDRPRHARAVARSAVHRARPRVAALVALSLAAVGIAGGLPGTVAPAVAADGSVSGTVFHDFDSDGLLDTTVAPGVPVDRGIGGVLVTAVDRDETVVGTATSGADGTYDVTVTGADTDEIRLTFSDLPAGYHPSYSLLAADGSGTYSRSDVQLVTIGDTDADFGINAPGDFSSAGTDTPVVSAIHYAGTRDNPYAATWQSLVVYPWQDQYTDVSQAPAFNLEPDPASPDRVSSYLRNGVVLAQTQDTGALWGMATQRSTGDVLAAALLKRHTDLGPLGIGGIYRVPDVMDPGTGLVGTPGAVEQWLDVSTLTDVAPPGLDLSPVGRPITDDPNNPGLDPTGYEWAGKVGIGGMAVSTDQTLLYAMNLYSKQLLVIDIASASLVDEIDLGLGDDDRPWAVEVHDGQVLVGHVSGTTAPTSAMTSVVRSAPETDLASLATAPAALTIGMDYLNGLPWERPGRSCTDTSPPSAPPDPVEVCLWHPWTDTFDATGWGIENEGAEGVAHAQPILSSIDFTADGELVVGLQDRFSLQMGADYYGPGGETNGTGGGFTAYSNGDTLIAAPDGAGGFTLESAGSIPGKSTAPGGRAEGPGGGEFFEDTNVYSAQWQDPDYVSIPPVHHETTTGALATIPGVDQILSTAYDPGGEYRTNGFSWFSTDDGSRADARIISGPETGASVKKAGGLGDVATLLPLAPLQIGNVVWFDADQDGRQDADEPPLPGVTVNLLDPQGATIATSTTDANGQYYFATDDPAIEGFDPDGGDYTVEFVAPTTGDVFAANDPSFATFGAVPWTEAALTVQGPTDDRGPEDQVDSDADQATGQVVYTAGSPGHNDPTIDAGYVADVSTSVEKVVENPDDLYVDPDQEFTIEVQARDFRGDPLGSDPFQTVTLADGESADVPESPSTLPAGAQILVTEPDVDPSYEVTIEPDDWFLVDGSSTDTTVTVTNTRVPSSGFDITKELTDTGGLVPPDTEFTGTWVCTYPDAGTEVGSGTWSVTAGETATVATDMPVGATCTVTEDPPTDVDDGEWVDPVVSDPIVIGAGDADPIPLVTVDNELDADATGFAITKNLTDDGSLVPDGTQFTGEWVCTYPDADTEVGSGDWTLIAGETVTVATDLPVGSVCTVTEDPPADQAGGDWVDPVVSAEVTLGVAANDPVPVVTVDNEFTPAAAGFRIAKSLTDDGDVVPADTVYSGTWQCTDPEGVVTDGTWSLEAGESTETLAADLPVGTECTVFEDPAPDVDGGTWEDPVISGTITLSGAGDADGIVQVAGVANEFTPKHPPTPTPTPTPTPGPGPLPATGADVIAVAGAALLLVLLGAGGVLLARRRHS
ncbi:DUF5979 domain-containing protein [Cellulosimicrobium arenosum]|uniref:LPXTG cell wall anchor domain-containing protein n=1 Tax=Cellulosimicrobium arenosum TaxID=2708133 RepID=A0A927J1A9_9MICO|nr:DUF5979 domain-containing protein [Cellulosimicrobium arenosum]MBD8079962.1 LPXTG cell wall anchor domain-containing protein [Cellulosimicrobium arenosum]